MAILEEDARLSESMLWSLQRRFYHQEGVEAWRRGLVPHYVTSNPFIAHSFAVVALGFLRDCAAAGEAARPIPIVELGAGSGRFGYHFIIELNRLLNQRPSSGISFKYILTDYAERNLDFWRTHPLLAPLRAAGQLDQARFDATRDTELKLEGSGEVLSSANADRPLIVFANYFFDSIPEDMFYVDGGQLYESRVSVLTHEGTPPPDERDRDALDKIGVGWRRRLAEPYDDPRFNKILDEYRRQLTASALPFPTTAMRVVERVRGWSSGRALFASADKGYVQLDALVGAVEPPLDVHGSFSMMVNYHALGRFVVESGGAALFQSQRSDALTVAAFVFGGAAVETARAYDAAVEQFGPDAFHAIKRLASRHYDDLTFEEWSSLMRLARWDARIFVESAAAVTKLVEKCTRGEVLELARVVARVWAGYFPIGEEDDIAFCLGSVLFKIAHYHEAIELFSHSLRLYGDNPATHYNAGICHYKLRQFEPALVHLEHALALDPALEQAKAARLVILAQLGRR